MAASVRTGMAFLQFLTDAGLLPPKCRRAVIEADSREALKITYECFGDERLFDQTVPNLLQGSQITVVVNGIAKQISLPSDPADVPVVRDGNADSQ